jgi:hypothetical protein
MKGKNMPSDNSTLNNTIQAMSSLMGASTPSGGISSMIMDASNTNLMQQYQAPYDASLTIMKKLKKNVFGQDYEWEVDAGITKDTNIETIINDIKNTFYPLLLSQNLKEFYCPPAVAAYVKLIPQYHQALAIDFSTTVYLNGFVDDIEIWKMPNEVFNDNCTCVCHTKDDKWFKAKVVNTSRY